jgi:hypothetical protein
MADNFSIDPNVLNAVKTHAQDLQAAMGNTQSHASQIASILSDVNRTYADMMKNGKDLGLDPAFLKQLQDIQKLFGNVGGAINKTVSGLNSEASAAKKTDGSLKSMVNTVQQKNKLVNDELNLIKNEGKELDKNAQKLTLLQKLWNQTKSTSKQMVGYASAQSQAIVYQTLNMAGLGGIFQKSEKNALGFKVSLAGVIKLIMDIMNKSNVIAGYSKMAGFSFKEWEPRTAGAAKAFGVANRALWDIRSRFRLSFEEAGKLTAKLTQAGFEIEDMGTSVTRAGSKTKDWQGTASRMLSVQTLQGRSMDTQLQSVMDLRNNFGELVTSAQSLDALIGDIGKKIPGLTAQDAVTSVMEMGRGMRFFTTDLLDSITLYHSLNNAAEQYKTKVAEARKHAEKTKTPYQAPAVESPWGKTWTTAPLDVRKSLLKWMTNAPARLAPGMQSLMGGGGPGASPTSKLWNFIETTGKKGPFEFYKKAMETVLQMTKGLEKDKGARYIAAKGMLESDYQMDPETAAYQARSIANGETNIKQLEELSKTLEKEETATRKKMEARESMMNEYLRTGVEVNTNLMTMEERLQKWLQDNLVTPINLIVKYLESIASFLSFQLPKDAKQTWEVIRGSTELQETSRKKVKGMLVRGGERTNFKEVEREAVAERLTRDVRDVISSKAASQIEKQIERRRKEAANTGKKYNEPDALQRRSMEADLAGSMWAELRDEKSLLKFVEENAALFAKIRSGSKHGKYGLRNIEKLLKALVDINEENSSAEKNENINQTNRAVGQKMDKKNVKHAKGNA